MRVVVPSTPSPTGVPFPELILERDKYISDLREIAWAMDRYVEKGLGRSLCSWVRDLGCSRGAWKLFAHSVGEALGPYFYITGYTRYKKHPHTLRAMWAEHIARSIYEQIGE